jgi:hypothetical protein
VAIWHDPLEELIAGLERALLAETWNEVLPLEVFQAVNDTILFGTPEEQEQLKTSPEWKRVTEHFDSDRSSTRGVRDPLNPPHTLPDQIESEILRYEVFCAATDHPPRSGGRSR